MGCIGGADRTFACKSQECLWQDWYILHNHFFHVKEIEIRIKFVGQLMSEERKTKNEYKS